MRTFKITISLLVVLALLCTGFAFAAVPEDVVGTSSEKAVEALMDAGAITGDDDGLYHPTDNLTRAQACIIIVKTIDPQAALVNGTATQIPKDTSFSDMKGYSWAENYIAYAVNQGIVKGYPDGTFKPGENVKTEDMAVMLVRAAKLAEDESTMTYPTDYMALAESKGIFEGIDKPYPELATKAMAAQMDYAVMDELKAAAPVVDNSDTPQGTDKDTAANVPATEDMTFVTGSFDASMSTFAGKSISGKAVVYTYGESKDYAQDMKFSTSKSDYRQDTVYKFKNVKTPAWYKVENDKITEIILPMDVGFSGCVYGVITGMSQVINVDGKRVDGIETLTATKPITWFAKSGLTGLPTESEYEDGQLYELQTISGEVRNVADPTGTVKGKRFIEYTTAGWTEVGTYKNNLMTSADGSVSCRVSSNASVYVIEDGEYTTARLSSIKAGTDVRMYDISDDEYNAADIVIVKE